MSDGVAVLQHIDAGQEHVEVDDGIVCNHRTMEGGQAMQLQAIRLGAAAGHCHCALSADGRREFELGLMSCKLIACSL